MPRSPALREAALTARYLASMKSSRNLPAFASTPSQLEWPAGHAAIRTPVHQTAGLGLENSRNVAKGMLATTSPRAEGQRFWRAPHGTSSMRLKDPGVTVRLSAQLRRACEQRPALVLHQNQGTWVLGLGPGPAPHPESSLGSQNHPKD